MDKKWMRNYIVSNIIFLIVIGVLFTICHYLNLSFVWGFVLLGICWAIILFFIGRAKM